MAFEPISGTIGAVAFADQMFARICEKKLESIEDDTAEQATITAIDETHVTEPLSPAAMSSSAPSTLPPSNLSSTTSKSVTRPSPSFQSLATSATESVTLSLPGQELPRRRDHFLGIFRSKKHKIPYEPDRNPPSTEQNVPIAVDEQQPVPEALTPLDSVLAPGSTAAASSEIAKAATEVHDRSNFLLRAGWVAQSRDRFIQLLKELKKHADYFHSMIQLDQGKKMVIRSQQMATVATKVKEYRDIGDRLRMLLQSLDQLTGSKRAEFQLMLHHDPLSLQSRYRKVTRLLSFQPEGAAFYARLLPPTEHTEGSAATTTARYLVFDVQQANLSPSIAGETIAARKLSDISHLLDDTDKTAQPLMARTLGCIKASGTTNGTISVFSDSTPHKDAKSLAVGLNDENEKKYFQAPSRASLRTRLALVLTCSLIYVQRADGLRDLNAAGLTFYDTDPASGHAADLGHSRIKPFILLQMLGVPTMTTSSHSVLTSAARDDDDDTVSMIRSLGILLYEIGSWDLSVGDTIAEKARASDIENLASLDLHEFVEIEFDKRLKKKPEGPPA
ncbi:hypothetical protein FMUND_14625 [Fusarium mundagurra]|uniref:Uncharacterized protein n=1 Tax=Fusarium mundagurra TaxID=1567541 RepID=A0A8H5XUV0_9HYPO|nr:hypothetical protein FMUND_14625 [Fusarium mundagurra]